MRALYVGSLALLTLIAGYFLLFNTVSSGVTVTPQVLSSTDIKLTAYQEEFIYKINEIRNTAGVEKVDYNLKSEKLAEFRVQDMIKNDYYSHKMPGMQTYANYLKDFGVEAVFSCENLQLQVGSSITEAIDAWTKSSKHYQCITDKRISTISVSQDVYSEVSTTDKYTQEMYLFAMIATD